MYLVAITDLATSHGSDLAPLAAAVGTTTYELKLTIAAGLPAVAYVCTDQAHAEDACSRIEKFGYRAVACDRGQLVMSDRMTALRNFRLFEHDLVADETAPERLAYDDLFALFRATHRTARRSTSEVKERTLRPGMALATGGLILSKTTKREVTTETVNHEQVLYLFRRNGPPWILRERGARYTGLGSELMPSSLGNFMAAIRKLRERAPSAVFDERLLHNRPIRGVADGIEATDLLANLMAADLVRLLARA